MAHPPSDAADERRLFTAGFIGLGLAELAYFTAAGLTIPLTPDFATGPLGSDAAGAGIAIGAFSLTALILRPLAGRLTDQRGRRPFLIGGALLAALAIAAHALTTDLAVLIGLRLVLGVAEAFFFVAGFAMVADLAPEGRAGEALSYNSLALYIGIAVGPLIGEMLRDAGGYDVAWLGGAAMCVGAGLIAMLFDETGERIADPGPLTLFHRRALLPSVGLFTGVVAMSGLLNFMVLYVDEVGLSGTGPVMLVFGAIVVGTRIAFARLPDRVPPFRLAAAALATIGLGNAIVVVVPTAVGLFIGAALTALGVAFTTPAFFAAIVQRTQAHERGTALGTTSLFIDLAFGAPLVLGFVAEAGGVPAAFAVGGVVAVIGAMGTAYAALSERPIVASAG